MAEVFEWYYVGNFGQLGPLSTAQMVELVHDGVIKPDTQVWRQGMQNYAPASTFPDLARAMPMVAPEPPSFIPSSAPPTVTATSAYVPQMAPDWANMPLVSVPQSEKIRILGGILNIVPIPGVGRMYLGYWGQGIAQLVLSACFGIGALWSVIDGILILCGTVRADGQGRPFKQ
jgi:TM2 domain-containing membrane protein YozV